MHNFCRCSKDVLVVGDDLATPRLVEKYYSHVDDPFTKYKMLACNGTLHTLVKGLPKLY